MFKNDWVSPFSFFECLYILCFCFSFLEAGLAATRAPNASLPAESVRGKRKRREDEEEMSVKAAKKQRSTSSEISTPEPAPAKRGGRRRREQEQTERNEASGKSAPVSPEDQETASADHWSFSGVFSSFCWISHFHWFLKPHFFSCKALNSDFVCLTDEQKEDVLWTDKYQPHSSKDVVGNAASVRRLHRWAFTFLQNNLPLFTQWPSDFSCWCRDNQCSSRRFTSKVSCFPVVSSWLKEWKLSVDRDERRKQKKQEEGSNG